MSLIVIAAGGTGGHFFPAEALAAELLRRGHMIALMTDARSGGQNSAVFAQGERFVISGAGIAGRGAGQKAKAGLALASGVVQARAILARLRPDAVVAFGGYPSVAPVIAARLLGRQAGVVLHEQNAVLGRANRQLCRFASTLALSFAETAGVPAGMRALVTGNPVRPAIAAHAGVAYDPEPETITLLVLGGSLGARVFSDVVPEAVSHLPEEVRARLHVVQQCRPEDLERVTAGYVQSGVNAELSTFFDDVADRLAQATMVIARAGASTVAELATIGRPSILVPLPGAIDDHQTANAQALAQAGAAVVIPQGLATPGEIATELAAWLRTPSRLADAAANAARLGAPDAALRLADLTLATIAGARA